MKNNTLLLIIGFIICILLGCLIWHGYEPREITKIDTVTVSDTLFQHDTLTIDRPVPKIVEKIKTDTVYTSNGDTLELVTETKHYQDTIIQQQDTAVVRAQVTGIDAQLDTVSVMFNRRVITNTVEITKIVEKKKTFKDKFHLQPQATFGYDPINKQWGTVVGIGLGIDIF